MIRSFVFICIAGLLASTTVFSQNTNSSTTTERPLKTTNTNQSTVPPQRPTDTEKPTVSPSKPKPAVKKPAVTVQSDPGADGVVAAFNRLLNGIRHADVAAVTGVYWNSPRLVLFNNNGTVTKGWDQVHKNREASYPELKDVKLEVRDVSVTDAWPRRLRSQLPVDAVANLQGQSGDSIWTHDPRIQTCW